METSVAWMVEGKVKPGKLDDLKTLVAEMVEDTSQEAGAQSYEWYLSEDESEVHLWEKYADSEATLAHVKRFGEQWARPFTDCLEVTRFRVYAAPEEHVQKLVAGWRPQYFAALGGFAR
jgi:quinol monooxygenase YgiN